MSSPIRLEAAPPVLELRQYLLHRGRRDELIELFDREFVEAQEATGMRVVGQFRDIDRPNHFVWLRGFDDHAARRAGLPAFYDGPVWARHGPAAAATMIDSDDVHLLRTSAEPATRLHIRSTSDRDAEADRGVALIVVAHRRAGQQAAHDDAVRRIVIPRVERAAEFSTAGLFETDPTENTFPRLPVRPSNVLVWIATGDHVDRLDDAARELSVARLDLAAEIGPAIRDEIRLDVLRLEPTSRSCLAFHVQDRRGHLEDRRSHLQV